MIGGVVCERWGNCCGSDLGCGGCSGVRVVDRAGLVVAVKAGVSGVNDGGEGCGVVVHGGGGG
ncbi:hypothetical protein HanRHA438_Chr17g0791091 [Helianthus annuus]|nr:hypothetical protein HanIR_Chr17g0847611 [Helianthus annuus]KAJ0824312.1 hypothetical protein HanRHA438_Chr17g0791091 [Helianthus annuus]